MALNLLELFNGKVFRIPDYQRGYAWGEKQLLELWDDLEEIPEDENGYRKHYTGTIYLDKCAPEENEKWLSGVTFYSVVDGQQRLTTLSILLFELVKVAKDGHCGESREDLEKTYLRKASSSGNSTIYKFSYSKRDNNHDFLLREIYEDKRFLLADQSLNQYRNNLAKAKEFFATRLNSIDHTQREVLFKKLTTALQFDLKTIEQDLDVQAVFETMNNRGKPLSSLEKLKNRLMYLTEKLKVVPEEKRVLRDKVNCAWGVIYRNLGQNANFVLGEDEFLSAYLSLYRKPKDAVFSENGAEERVFQMFCNKPEKYPKHFGDDEPEAKVTYEKIDDFILNLSDVAPVWFAIHNSESLIIKRILILNGGKELKIFLLATLLKKDPAVSDAMFISLERALFRNRTLWFFDEGILATWARDIYLNGDTLESIKQRICDLLSEPVSKERLIQTMNSLFTYQRGSIGFHRWGALKYFLYDYENALKLRCKESDDKMNIDDFNSKSIEHIIPRGWPENWAEVVNDFTAGMETEKKDLAIKVLINTLGNLTILKDGKNSSVSNSGWLEKRERYHTGSYNEIDISTNTMWTKDEILKRGIDMLSVLEERIGGLVMSADDKYKLLFYDDCLISKFKVPVGSCIPPEAG